MMSLFQVSTVVNVAPLHQKKLNRKETRVLENLEGSEKKTKRAHIELFGSLYSPIEHYFRKKKIQNPEGMIFFSLGKYEKGKKFDGHK